MWGVNILRGGCTYREVGSALCVLRMCTAGVSSTTSSAFRISPFIRSVRILVKRRKNFDDPTYLDNWFSAPTVFVFFLPLNSNMYLKARETMSGTSRILWATLSSCLHLWVARVCHHVPFISNTCFIYFYTELRDHVSVSGLLVQAEAWRNCVEKDGCK